MRRVRVAAAVMALGFLTAGLAAGCYDFLDDCHYTLTCVEMGGPDGGDGGPQPSCIPSQNSTPVDASCGVFVSSESGDDTHGKGTQTEPYKTIGKALAESASTIYACAGTTPYSEAVTVSTAVTLFGALDCGTWAYDAANKTQLTAAADAVPLSLTSAASGSEVEDFSITAADAMTAGGSSIAVLDNGAALALTRCDLTAGNGVTGATGTAQSQVTTPAGATGGDGGDNTCGSTSNGGGNPGQNMCSYMGNMVDTSGGGGGGGTNGTMGTPGTGGNPMGTNSNGGSAQTSSASCNPGTKGSDGSPGMSGSGASGLGTVDASGYRGPTAAAGQTAGAPGQGGGGGGGADQCSGGGSGPGGGGGGAGGCGGGPGNPGQSGGSSIGILALGATLSLANVTITAKSGGEGGAGGDGQRGANGGQQGNQGGSGACPGAPGGQGGRGGSGGGGAGGHSAGIAVNGGTLPDLSTTTITYEMTAASGAAGGDMDMTVQGASGKTCKTLDFTTPSSPTACAM